MYELVTASTTKYYPAVKKRDCLLPRKYDLNIFFLTILYLFLSFKRITILFLVYYLSFSYSPSFRTVNSSSYYRYIYPFLTIFFLMTDFSQLLTDPKILFLDEPTTGQDSHSANCVISQLKSFAAKGRTVLCTIHQPSSDIFSSFDRIILIAEGRVAFSGRIDQAVEFFAR